MFERQLAICSLSNEPIAKIGTLLLDTIFEVTRVARFGRYQFRRIGNRDGSKQSSESVLE